MKQLLIESIRSQLFLQQSKLFKVNSGHIDKGPIILDHHLTLFDLDSAVE